jgi:hypothetical protein
MDTDFPAAHSMDTVWFAVDRDGHVALFRSGEAGAVPEEAFAGDEAYRAQRELMQLLPASGIRVDLAGRVMPGEEEARHYRDNSLQWPVLMFLNSFEPVQWAIDAGQAQPLQATPGVAIILRGLSTEDHKELHDEGVCRGCFVFYEDPQRGPSQRAADHGFYEYDHLTENWISGPYGRERCPQQPVHIDQLPPEIREQIKSMRFDSLRFTDTPHIQPVEHAECISWEGAWMDVTGKHIRPIPGQEELYAEAYDEMAGDFSDRYTIEPPSDIDADEEEEE